MNEERVTVAIVLDPNFGERLSELAAQGPVWVAGSVINRAAVEHHWKTAPSGAHSVTIWSERPRAETEKQWLGILDDVELHHSEAWAWPGIAGIQVIGAPLTKAAESALHEFDYVVTSSGANGFIAVRTIHSKPRDTDP
jgi:hypothetical protein